jgi:hypothetical protein
VRAVCYFACLIVVFKGLFIVVFTSLLPGSQGEQFASTRSHRIQHVVV